MTTQPPRSYTKLAITILLAAVVVGAGFVGASYFGTARTSTTTTTAIQNHTLTSTSIVTSIVTSSVSSGSSASETLTTSGNSTTSVSTVRTCTAIPAISYLYCGGSLRISAVGTPGAGPGVQSTGGTWNFTATISSNSVAHGQTIVLWANLTNIGSDITFSEFVRPYINPEVYTANGTEVWAWDPPQSTWPNWNITSGETTSQDVSIPTSQLLAGQSYYVTVAPISVQFPTPNNLTFTFQFSVTAAENG